MADGKSNKYPVRCSAVQSSVRTSELGAVFEVTRVDVRRPTSMGTRYDLHGVMDRVGGGRVTEGRQDGKTGSFNIDEL